LRLVLSGGALSPIRDNPIYPEFRFIPNIEDFVWKHSLKTSSSGDSAQNFSG